MNCRGQRIKPIVVDPGLYLARKTQIFYATEKRPLPEAFQVFTGRVLHIHITIWWIYRLRIYFLNWWLIDILIYSITGSPWVILSRPFLEFCVFGWDNLPRTLLMYFTNAVLSQEVYFHSVVCNSPEFKNTTVNSDMRYMVWDNPPKMEPLFLNTSDYDLMAQSGAAFARQFNKDETVLDMIDQNILKRSHNRVTPGAWCTGRKSWRMDPCSRWGDVNVLKPGPQVKNLGDSVQRLLQDLSSQSNQCRWRAKYDLNVHYL